MARHRHIDVTTPLGSIVAGCKRLNLMSIRDDEVALCVERELRRIDAHLWSLIRDLEEGII